MFPRFIPFEIIHSIFTKGSQKDEDTLIPAKHLKKNYKWNINKKFSRKDIFHKNSNFIIREKRKEKYKRNKHSFFPPFWHNSPHDKSPFNQPGEGMPEIIREGSCVAEFTGDELFSNLYPAGARLLFAGH